MLAWSGGGGDVCAFHCHVSRICHAEPTLACAGPWAANIDERGGCSRLSRHFLCARPCLPSRTRPPLKRDLLPTALARKQSHEVCLHDRPSDRRRKHLCLSIIRWPGWYLATVLVITCLLIRTDGCLPARHAVQCWPVISGILVHVFL